MGIRQYDELLENFYNECDKSCQERRELEESISDSANDILAGCKEEFALNEQNCDKRIIVSLTSIPERLEYAVYPIQCMLIQTKKPHKIVLWLDEQKLRDELLPQELLDLKQYGLDIRYVEDIGPHTKYFYALKYYADDIVITIDDDMLYQRTLIEGLMNSHKINPDCVCAYWVWQMKFSRDGVPYSSSEYRVGQETQNDVPSDQFAALGFGGVLYPPHCLDDRAFNIEKIRKLALKADDVWLKAMETLNGIRVVKAAGRKPYPHVRNSQATALQYENLKGRNDRIIKNVFQHYQLMPYFCNIEKKENVKVRTLLKWVEMHQNNREIGEYLVKKGIHTVAVYGMSQLGKLILGELNNSRVQVKYGIDRKAGDIWGSIPIVPPEKVEEEVDLIIVTAPVSYRDISAYLRFDMISIEDLLVEMDFFEDKI